MALRSEDLIAVIPVLPGCVFPRHGPVAPVELRPVHYMDDTAVPIVAWHATALLGKLARVTNLYRSICWKHGLRVNFKAGKTEALVWLIGPGAVAASAMLDALPKDDGSPSCFPVPLLDCGADVLLRIVPAYRHLGGVLSTSSSMGVEVAARCAAARVACGALQRSCLAKQAIDEAARVHTAVACVHNRLGSLACGRTCP